MMRQTSQVGIKSFIFHFPYDTFHRHHCEDSNIKRIQPVPPDFFNFGKRTDNPPGENSPAMPGTFFKFDEQTIKAPSTTIPEKSKKFWPVQNPSKQIQPLNKKFWPELIPLMALSLLALTACSGAPGDYKSYLQSREIGLSTPESIRHCHAYGCQRISNINITKKDWRKITAIFRPRAKNAAAERLKIAKAIGLFERTVGPLAGTQFDERGTFRKTGNNQLDCVDESTNTTTYISLLENAGLLKFHTLAGPTMRFPIVHAGRWPHQTAVIRETGSGILYAVDSWFRDNGAEADIIPLKEWKQGWKPPDVHDLL